jgi:hypothetical protein
MMIMHFSTFNLFSDNCTKNKLNQPTYGPTVCNIRHQVSVC